MKKDYQDICITVNSVEDFIKEIFRLDNLPDGRTFIRETLVYRGQQNKDWALKPAIARDRKWSDEITIFDEERHLIECAKNQLPYVFSNELLPVDLLALLQHHGIPTRLLDVTENPLVALYFACGGSQDRIKKDGEVVVFCKEIDDITTTPLEHAIADTYRFAETNLCAISKFYRRASQQTYFLELVDYFESSQRVLEILKERCKNIIFVRSKELAKRQRLQQGQYILFPNVLKYVEGFKEECFDKRIEEIPKNSGFILKRIIIPAEEKEKILKQLGLLGINYGILFGDSTDAICKQIYDDAIVRVKKNTDVTLIPDD